MRTLIIALSLLSLSAQAMNDKEFSQSLSLVRKAQKLKVCQTETKAFVVQVLDDAAQKTSLANPAALKNCLESAKLAKKFENKLHKRLEALSKLGF